MLESVSVELSVVLGSTHMPIHQLLRMGRGAVIELDATEKDDVMVLANNVPVAHGTVVIRGDRVAIEITQMIHRLEIGEVAA
jgi:flagellar motor switch protein FliN/FliY